MTKQNTARHGTAMAETVDAAHGTTTGVSAFDRAATVAVFVDDSAGPDDLARPGHVIPLSARDGGVLVRAGHTEAIVDLCRMAGFKSVGVGCEIIAEDGSMMRRPQLELFCQEHGLKMCTIADLISFRVKGEQLVKRLVSVNLPTRWGAFRARLPERNRRAAAPGPLQGRRRRSWTLTANPSPTTNPCWCASTVSASPAMSSAAPAATAAPNWTWPWK
jgi:hypothetical protein